MSDYLQTLFSSVIGFAFVGGMLSFIYWRHGWRWRRIQQAFPEAGEPPIRKWHLQSVYCHADGLIFNSYRGMVTIGVGEDGLTFSVIPPFSLIQSAFFVPYRDLMAYQQDWLLMGRCCQLEFRGVPDMKMVIPGRVGDLLLDYSHPLFAQVKRPGKQALNPAL